MKINSSELLENILNHLQKQVLSQAVTFVFLTALLVLKQHICLPPPPPICVYISSALLSLFAT